MVLVAAIGLGSRPAAGQEAVPAKRVPSWGQWLGGSERNGGVHTGALASARHLKSTVRWKAELGAGYSSVSVHGDTALVMFTADEGEVLAAINTGDGTQRWRIGLEPKDKPGDWGPLSTPATDGGSVFALGSRGHLYAVGLANGKKRWSHDLVKGFGARQPNDGFATSPLVFGDLVVVAAGGTDGKSLLAFRKTSGELAWSAQSDLIEYGSPAASTIAGVTQIIMASTTRVFGVRGSTGELLWSLEAKPDTWSTPLPLPGDRVFLPLARTLALVRIEREGIAWKAETVWEKPGYAAHRFFAHADNFLYGCTAAGIVCLDAKTGREVWKEEVAQSSGVRVGNRMFALEVRSGDLRGFNLVPDAYQEVFRQNVFSSEGHWTVPSFADGQLFLRSKANFVALPLEPGE